MKQHEGDFDETSFIDAVSRNLSKGKFLLIVVGNGIREGVEDISDYLQQNPSLHFSLALVELSLYRLYKGQDYPLYVQPRTLAKTVELVRAVVDIKAPVGVEANVEIPSEEEVEKGKARRKLTEEIFLEELAENKSKELAKQVQELIQELQDIGLVCVWRSSSVSMRLPDPAGSGIKFTFIIIELAGTYSVGYLDYIVAPEYGGYNEDIVYRYRNCVAEISDMPIKNTFAIDDSMPISKLLERKEDYLNCVRRFIDDLKREADEREE